MYGGGHGDAGASQFAGGGFMPQSSQGDDGYSPSAGGRRSSTSSTNQKLTPLTVKQLSEAFSRSADDSFIVDNEEVGNITIVGRVVSFKERATDVVIDIDDGTGKIEVIRWIDSDNTAEVAELQAIQNGVYLRVYGHLGSFEGKKRVKAFGTRAVSDHNEVTHHFLECVLVHVSNTKKAGKMSNLHASVSSAIHNASPMKPDGGYETNISSYPSANSRAPNQSQFTKPPAYSDPSALNKGFGNSNSITNKGREGSTGDLKERIMAIYNDPNNAKIEAGLSVQFVAQNLPGFTRDQVQSMIDFLVEEGMLYSCLEDSYKSTEADC